MKNQILFLGTGGSAGVPMIGCRCPVCTSQDLKNHRKRSSVLLNVQGKKILIDAGLDFRAQALLYDIAHIDALLLTHAHADHIGGMDDLRPFYFLNHKKLPCYLSKETLEEVKLRYHYFFHAGSSQKSMSAQIDFFPLIEESGQVDVQGICVNYFSFSQNGMKVTGFRIGSFAYVSDIRQYPATIFKELQGVDILVLSALRQAESSMHFSIDEAVEFSRNVQAKRTFLTHLSHEVDHEKVSALLPQEVQLGFDGLMLPFE